MGYYENYLVQILWVDLCSGSSARDPGNNSGSLIHGPGMYGHCKEWSFCY